MAFDAAIGVLLDGENAEHWERKLRSLNRELARHGQPPHSEPRALSDIAPPLRRRGAGQIQGVRLGFYGDAKYHRLMDLVGYLLRFGVVPPAPPIGGALDWSGEAASPREEAGFDHLLAMLGVGTILVPRELPCVLDAADPADLVRIASAPCLRREAVFLANVLGWFQEGAADFDWLLATQPDGNPSYPGVRPTDSPEIRASWEAEADLCGRLLTVADRCLRLGAVAITT